MRFDALLALRYRALVAMPLNGSPLQDGAFLALRYWPLSCCTRLCAAMLYWLYLLSFSSVHSNSVACISGKF
jgi:hypothetical protein